jgi:hypothetical protein
MQFALLAKHCYNDQIKEREMDIAYIALVRKPEGKRPVGTHSHRWKSNIKMGIKRIGGYDLDLTGSG